MATCGRTVTFSVYQAPGRHNIRRDIKVEAKSQIIVRGIADYCRSGTTYGAVDKLELIKSSPSSSSGSLSRVGLISSQEEMTAF